MIRGDVWWVSFETSTGGEIKKRHPQYLGGILAIFMTTLLWYPHWLFGLLGIIGTAVVYMGSRDEDQRLIKQFSDEYIHYMKKVPGMNLLAGVIRLLRHRKGEWK